MNAKNTVHRLASLAEIELNGRNPWDPQVHDERFYSRVLQEGSLGLGESYMDGWWDCKQTDELVCRLLHLKEKFKSPLFFARNVGLLGPGLGILLAQRLGQKRLPSPLRTSEGIRSTERAAVSSHYDTGNDLFEAMLDHRMTYSCGYWREAQTLDDAQEAKLDLICRKLGLRPGMRVLDIGCGWASFLQYAAESYGIEGVGINISPQQAALAQQRCAGLPIDIRVQNYRDVQETFDRIISVGMFEHVRAENYRTYMEAVHRCLANDGLSLLHTIGGIRDKATTDAWLTKYIFPHGMLPAKREIQEAASGLLGIADWHVFGQEPGSSRPHDYDQTLMAWRDKFSASWDWLKHAYQDKVGGRFHRMWGYYLLCCAGMFRAGNAELWQIILAKGEKTICYTPVR